MCTEVYFALPVVADVAAMSELLVRRRAGRGLSEGFSVQSQQEGLLELGELLHLAEPWANRNCGNGPDRFSEVVTEALRTGISHSVGVISTEGLFARHGKRMGPILPIERLSIEPENFNDATEFDVLYVTGKPPEKRQVVHRHDGRRRSSRQSEISLSNQEPG